MKRIEAGGDVFYTMTLAELIKVNITFLLAGNFFTLVGIGIWVWVCS